MPYQTFTTGAETSTQSGFVSQFGFQAFISRVNYDYANKYLFQAVLRADGSSRFAPGHNWGYFPAGSVGWVASEESFIKDKLPWVDLLKFRASFGLTGSDNTKAYQYAVSYNLGTASAGGAVFNEAARTIGILTNTAIANSNVTWDHNYKTDYGVDMQFLKSRLSVTADYFWNHGYDLLTTLTSSVPVTIGAAAPTENYGIINTFGYELSTGWRDHVGKKFNYSFTPFFTWSDNKNIQIDVSAANKGTLLDYTGTSSDRGVVGYKSLGIIRTQADADAIIASRTAAAGGAANVKILGATPAPGMINYADLNGDGIISTDYKDQEYLTKRSTNHYGLGLNWSVGYGPVNFNVVMGMSFGGWTSTYSASSYLTENKPVYWANHWTPTNTDAKYPAPYYTTYSNGNYNVASDFWLVRATSLSVTSANLSYTIPTKLTSKIGIASARLYAVGTNLIQFINPFPNGYRDFYTGVYTYPTLRSVSLGLNVGF